MANLSKRSAGVRRLLQESAELLNDDSPDYSAQPLESDLFDWHFTIRGLSASQFEGGVYHGRMILPSEYPFKPPEIYLLTPSGRFEVNKKICLSISSFHPETWQPSWGVRTALLALISFFESDPKGAVGSLNAPPEERKRLANASRLYKCSTCGYDATNHDSFSALPVPAPEPTPSTASTVPEKVSVEEAGSEGEEEETENEVVPETEEVSEANSRSSTPPPSVNAVKTPSLPPTAIFPSTPHPAPRNYPSSSPNSLSPSPVTDHHPSASASSSGPSRPHHHQPTPSTSSPRYSPASPPSASAPRLAHSHARIASPSVVSTSTPVHPPPSPAEQPVARAQSAALPAGVSLAQADFGGEGEGGPPSYLDRAILATLLAIVALLVRKVA